MLTLVSQILTWSTTTTSFAQFPKSKKLSGSMTLCCHTALASSLLCRNTSWRVTAAATWLSATRGGSVYTPSMEGQGLWRSWIWGWISIRLISTSLVRAMRLRRRVSMQGKMLWSQGIRMVMLKYTRWRPSMKGRSSDAERKLKRFPLILEARRARSIG